jgi:hypothetical protein
MSRARRPGAGAVGAGDGFIEIEGNKRRATAIERKSRQCSWAKYNTRNLRIAGPAKVAAQKPSSRIQGDQYGDRILAHSHCQSGRIRPGNGPDARFHALGCGRTSARDPIGVMGRIVRGQTGSPYRHPSPWRAADHRLCLVGHLRRPLGARGEYAARAQAGDFIHVPAFLPHMEINPSESEPFHWVVVRSTATAIVVNLPTDMWSW